MSLNIEEYNEEKKFIPVLIDNTFLEDDIQSKMIESIDEILTKIKDETIKLWDKGQTTKNLDFRRNLLEEFKKNLDDILMKLHGSLRCDMIDDKRFKHNLHKLIEVLST